MWHSPLEIFVAWEPDSPYGEHFACTLFSWFTGDPEDPLSNGPGIPVSFRCPPDGDVKKLSQIPWSRSQYAVLVVLVDNAMVANKEKWRDWLETALAQSQEAPDTRCLLVCGLSKHFANLSRELANAQAMRLVELMGQTSELEMELKARLSNEICRMVDPARKGGEATKVFVSHAKRDGRVAASALKSYIDDAPVGEVFFDEVSLQPSKAFEEEFRRNLAHTTLVVLMTDSWASRYWCQWEALQGKKLDRPILLVDILSEGERRHFPYLGNVPTVRINAGALAPSDCRRVVAAVQLETLRDLHERLRLSALADAGRLPEHAHFLTRAPELATLVNLLEEEDEEKKSDPDSVPDDRCFVYPDPPIADHELALIRRYKPNLEMGTPIELLSGQSGTENPLKNRIISVSVSDSPDLFELGLGKAHLDRLWVALSRHLLALGAGVAYGGDLRSGGYTEMLFDLVKAHADEGRMLDERMVHWYLSWPIHLKVDEDVRAALSDVIEVHAIDKPADVVRDDDTFVPPAMDPYAWIRSLTEMRRQMVTDTDARILVGGQLLASTPRSGIAEEFMCSLDAKQPIYLCGGFGGMSTALSEALQKQTPESLTDNFHIETKAKRKAYDDYNATDAGKADPIDYKKLVERLADEGVDGLRNGLSIEENRRLFESQSVEEIVGLVREGLNLTLGKK